MNDKITSIRVNISAYTRLGLANLLSFGAYMLSPQ